VLQDGGDTGFEERQVHQANAAEIAFLLVFSDDFAETSNNILRGRSESHNTLVLRRDGKVVEGQASKVTTISTLLSQALRQRRQHIILSTANHRNAVLLVTNITELIDSLRCGSALLTLGVQHLLNQFRNVVEGWGLRWSRRLCSRLVKWKERQKDK
jgi:hypothetical protein